MISKQKCLTLGDYTLQPDDVWIIKLSHDARLSQKVPSLPLCVTSLQSLYSNRNFLLSWYTKTPTAHLPKLTFRIHSGLNCHSAFNVLQFMYKTLGGSETILNKQVNKRHYRGSGQDNIPHWIISYLSHWRLNFDIFVFYELQSYFSERHLRA